MSVVSFDGVTLFLGHTRIVHDLSLRLFDDDRVGLVGANGSGKTSLLRLIVGELEPDQGRVLKRRDCRVGLLPQELEVQGGESLLAFVRRQIPGRDELHRRLGAVEAELAAPATGADEARLSELTVELAHLHERVLGYERDYADHQALRILAGLGFVPGDEHRDLGHFSGGWRMRAVLASLLFLQPDLLLLDEPTNHLDMPTVGWLGAFLQSYRRPFVLICHDREFLNDQVNRVVSFEAEGVRQYRGNYERYVLLRQQESEVLENRAKNLARERETAQRFIDRFRYQASKARAVQSRVKALEKLDEVVTLGERDTVHFVFPPTPHTSRQVLRAEALTKGFGGPPLFADLSLSVMKGERIGVLGINGAGKTTLLRLLAGELEPDQGGVHLGQHVTRGYFAQDQRQTLDPDATVFDEVARAAAGALPRTIRSLLGGLGFSGDAVDKKIAVLSGGERARVALGRLLVAPTSLIIMDEPTNHLDLRSAERLAESLTTFDGTLIFASHNKSFVRRLATRIWNVAAHTVEVFPGTLDEYLTSSIRQLQLPEEAAFATADAGPAAAERPKGGDKERRRREAEERAHRRTVLGPIEARLSAIETEITTLEVVQAERSAALADPKTMADTKRIGELHRAFGQDAARLATLNREWEAVGTELDRARAELASGS
ncbi:MAG: ABC-F family ATP-binding cassette domain-containing protein [Deltaproteobacteria bacterium]|nr:ABC-F family ATP-binding cassette domain-containing protein [Deltaproteobacteria bacterium]